MVTGWYHLTTHVYIKDYEPVLLHFLLSYQDRAQEQKQSASQSGLKELGAEI